MRVLLVDQYSELGGGQRCLIEVAAGFAARGWEIQAAFPPPEPGPQEQNNGPLAVELAPFCTETYPIPCGPFASTRKSSSDALRFAMQLPAQVAILRRILRRARDVNREMDVLYVNGPRMLPAAALARGVTPVIFHAHWDVPQLSASGLVMRAARKSRAHIVASSRSVALRLERVLPVGRISVVYNGVSLKSELVRRSPRGPIRHIAVLGRIAPEKGQLEFVRAARIVGRSASELRFSIFGAPMFADDRYFAQVRAESAGCPVEFPGWTEDTATAFGGMDLLVVPSDPTDNIPRVIMEAFAARVPVIAFPSGGIPELIEHGVTGVLVDSRTPAGLAHAIVEAVAHPDEMNAMADRAFDRWRERYTLERFQSEVCGVVEDVVRRHHQRQPRASASVDPAA